ncbi:MAG TPA: thrombospondin type 3 repeat-containing protein [Kofleriaceae bacterium]|nr:thrombospondin type 3 repeat-containing protein [Kofleriaceae bacterium]
MARWLALLALAGCYNPSYQAGGSCSTACPGDLLCIDHVCVPPGTSSQIDGSVIDARPVDALPDANVIDGPPGDLDADGINDNLDNCPSKGNVDQHDEDADSIGDVCDPCPHLAGNAADQDGDGVGDMCDPQVGVAKQRILFFDPFTSTRSQWTYNNGTTRVGETLKMSGNNADSQLLVPNGEVRIETGGTIVSVGATPNQLSIEFGEGVAGKYHYCEFYNGSGTQGDVGISKANSGTYTSVNLLHYPAPMPASAWHMRIDESVAAQQITLEATLGGTTYGPFMGKTDLATPNLTTGPDIDFYVQHGDVRFDYFIVIETLP